MSASREAVLEALRSVPEPCAIAMGRDLDIRQMGLVESVEIEAGEVAVTLVLTDPSCVHFRAMRDYITDVLTELEGVESVAVSISTTELWTPDRLEPTAAG